MPMEVRNNTVMTFNFTISHPWRNAKYGEYTFATHINSTFSSSFLARTIITVKATDRLRTQMNAEIQKTI
jgi:subtilase family serine protease